MPVAACAALVCRKGVPAGDQLRSADYMGVRNTACVHPASTMLGNHVP